MRLFAAMFRSVPADAAAGPRYCGRFGGGVHGSWEGSGRLRSRRISADSRLPGIQPEASSSFGHCVCPHNAVCWPRLDRKIRELTRPAAGRETRGLRMRYESNRKHKEPWQRGRRGTLCPSDIDVKTVHRLLADSEATGDKRYAVHEGRAFCAQRHGAEEWHGYPIGWVEVPEAIRRKWLKERRVQRRDIRRHWD